MSKELEEMPQGQSQKQPLEDKTMAEIITNKNISSEDQILYMKKHFGKKKNVKLRKYDPKFVGIARKLATLGLTQEDMAVLFGVSAWTLSGWKRRYQPFAKAIKEGDAMKRVSLLDAIMKNVKAGSFAVQIFLAKNWLGMTDKVDSRVIGDIGITYKSNIPQEKGTQEVDPETIKKKGSKK